MPEEPKLAEDEFYKILNHPARRTMIRLLHDKIEMTYSEILRDLGMDEGQFNFHLRLVKKLTQETADGKYALSQRGRTAYDLMTTMGNELDETDAFNQPPPLSRVIVAKRMLAFVIDVAIFLTLSGIIFDPRLWSSLWELTTHATGIFSLHPWIFHPEHLPQVGEFLSRLVGEYAHVFFAMYIAFTLLDAYKGQTLGKFLMKIRVTAITGRRLDLVESAVRNIGKVFFLPLDLLLGLFYFRRGFIKFFDYYTGSKVEKVNLDLMKSVQKKYGKHL